jgi:hypothetical protein
MRSLLTAVIFVATISVLQARQADPRPHVPPKDPPRSSEAVPPDRLLVPQGTRGSSRGKTVETIIPDICTGC